MTISRGDYTLKGPSTPSMSLSDAATELGITPQKCSRIIKKFNIPVSRIGYLVLLGPREFTKVKMAFQQMKKKKAKSI